MIYSYPYDRLSANRYVDSRCWGEKRAELTVSFAGNGEATGEQINNILCPFSHEI